MEIPKLSEQEMEELLWKFTRIAYPNANGSLRIEVYRALGFLGGLTETVKLCYLNAVSENEGNS